MDVGQTTDGKEIKGEFVKNVHAYNGTINYIFDLIDQLEDKLEPYSSIPPEDSGGKDSRIGSCAMDKTIIDVQDRLVKVTDKLEKVIENFEG